MIRSRLLPVGLAALVAVAGSIGALVLYSNYSSSARGQASTSSLSTQTKTTESNSSSSKALSTLPSILDAETANVTLSPWPGRMWVNPVSGKVYISDLFANKLTVLNASTWTVMRTITLPGTAEGGIIVDAKNNILFVPVYGCTNLSNATNSCTSAAGARLKGGIVRVDGRNDRIVGELGIDVQRLAIDPVSSVLYAISTNRFPLSSNPTSHLLGIDEQSGAILSNVSVSASALDTAVNPGRMIYLSACGKLLLACEDSEVLAINNTSHAVQWKVSLGFDAINFPLVVSPSTNSVYVLGLTGANLTLDSIDGVTGKLNYSSDLGSSCAGAGGGGLTVDTATGQLYAVSSSEDWLLVVDAATGQLVSTMTTPQSGGEYNIALNPAAHEVYLTLERPHKNIGYFLVLSEAALNADSHVDESFLQRGVCLP